MDKEVQALPQVQSNHFQTDWVESLALDELNMDESGMVNFGNDLDPRAWLEESSISFMDQLRDLVEVYSAAFNDYRGDDSHHIRIFKISNTVNDFMLFRNSLRLIFARKSCDTISVGLLSSNGVLYRPRLNIFSNHPDSGAELGPGSHLLVASVGPFGNIKWLFEGQEVDLKLMIRHYVSEFIKSSAR